MLIKQEYKFKWLQVGFFKFLITNRVERLIDPRLFVVYGVGVPFGYFERKIRFWYKSASSPSVPAYGCRIFKF